MVVTVYICIALIFSLVLILVDAGEDKSNRIIEHERDGKAIALLIVAWPFTILLTIMIFFYEMYKSFYCKKAIKIMEKYGFCIDKQWNRMSLDELKTIHKAVSIKSISLSDKTMKEVEQLILDKDFEKYILNHEE